MKIKDTGTKCQKEFILSIFDVTEDDEGTYSCHSLCEEENTIKAAIALKVVDDLQTGKVFLKFSFATNCDADEALTKVVIDLIVLAQYKKVRRSLGSNTTELL